MPTTQTADGTTTRALTFTHETAGSYTLPAGTPVRIGEVSPDGEDAWVFVDGGRGMGSQCYAWLGDIDLTNEAVARLTA